MGRILTVYCIAYMDYDQNVCRKWARSQVSADLVSDDLRDGGHAILDVYRHEVPTTKDDLIDWLNVQAN